MEQTDFAGIGQDILFSARNELYMSLPYLDTALCALDFAPGQIDYCLVTHAHIDHSGRLPLLVKEGFQGQIITTRLTAQLLSIMLRDSAHIQESDAQWQNQKGKRAGRELAYLKSWRLSNTWINTRWLCRQGTSRQSTVFPQR